MFGIGTVNTYHEGMMSDYTYIGIDVAKNTLCCSIPDRKPFNISNNVKGIKSLVSRASAIDDPANLLFVMESTGGYSEFTADALDDLADAKSSIVPPARIVGFRQAEQINTKNDPTDAGIIRKFALKHNPQPWLQPTQAQRHLRRLNTQMENLTKAIAQQKCVREKLEFAYRPDEFAIASVDRVIRFLNEEIDRLQAEFDRTVADDEAMATDAANMLSIPGVGPKTCNMVLTLLYPHLREKSDRKLLKQCGMEHKDHQSGIHKGYTRMSKAGDGRVRRALILAARGTVRKGGIYHDYYQRQKASDKEGMVIMVNVMRKLLYLIKGVVRSGKPFDMQVILNGG